MKARAGFSAHFAENKIAGAVTVEYAVVFTIVIICILILVYVGMLYYQQCLMQAVVSENVRSLAFLWGFDPGSIDMKAGLTGKDAYVDESLYWHIFTDTDKRKNKAAQAVQNELMSKSVIKPHGGFDVEVTFRNLIIHKRVGISAKAVYSMPFKRFFEYLGSSGYVMIKAHCETTINDPQDFIQNTDYLIQIYEESGFKDRVLEKLEPLVNTLQKIKDYFK